MTKVKAKVVSTFVQWLTILVAVAFGINGCGVRASCKAVAHEAEALTLEYIAGDDGSTSSESIRASADRARQKWRWYRPLGLLSHEEAIAEQTARAYVNIPNSEIRTGTYPGFYAYCLAIELGQNPKVL